MSIGKFKTRHNKQTLQYHLTSYQYGVTEKNFQVNFFLIGKVI